MSEMQKQIFCKQSKPSEIRENTLRFRASTPTKDRDGDTVNQEGWKLDAFMKNPVFLFGHDRSLPPIGKVVAIDVADEEMIIDVKFDDQDEFAMKVFKKFKSGFLNAVSVGFRGLEHTSRQDGIDFQSQELMEISAVPVPANPDAVMLRGLKQTDLIYQWAKQVVDMAEKDDAKQIDGTSEEVMSMLEVIENAIGDIRDLVTPEEDPEEDPEAQDDEEPKEDRDEEPKDPEEPKDEDEEPKDSDDDNPLVSNENVREAALNALITEVTEKLETRIEEHVQKHFEKLFDESSSLEDEFDFDDDAEVPFLAFDDHRN